MDQINQLEKYDTELSISAIQQLATTPYITDYPSNICCPLLTYQQQ